MAPYGEYSRKDVHFILIPPRPKRPMTHYNLFVKAYWERNTLEPGKYKTGASVFAAASQWRIMDNVTKKTYYLKAAKEKVRYRMGIRNWAHLIKNRIKHPLPIYPIYLKETWEHEKKIMKPRSFRTLNKHIAETWSNLRQTRIKSYGQRFREAMKQLPPLLQSLKNGQEMDAIDEFDDFDEAQ